MNTHDCPTKNQPNVGATCKHCADVQDSMVNSFLTKFAKERLESKPSASIPFEQKHSQITMKLHSNGKAAFTLKG